MRLASSKPRAPVPAFALPLLMTMPRAEPCFSSSRPSVTGAAQNRFVVNNAATAA